MRAIDLAGLAENADGLFRAALADQRPRTLVFGAPDTGTKTALASLSVGHLVPGKMPRDAQAARLVIAGLWLAFDFMDEAHAIAQEIETPSGGYWHGIIHRREPDAGNAAYWFRRVRAHAIWPELLADARELYADDPSLRALVEGRRWDAPRFSDLCTATEDVDPDAAPLQAIAVREWALLVEHDFRAAFG